jgi:hypothetical protein
MTPRIALLIVPALFLPGCAVKTALDVATLPVKVGAKAVDVATTSKSEADRKRGRELRKKCKRDYDPDYCEK